MRFLLPALTVLGLLILLGVGLTLVSLDDLLGAPTVVNYFASWCTPCLVEHPLLMRIARERRVRLVGINYKDPPAEALRWLARHGDPYVLIAQDLAGSAGLDWGVYGVPETYLLDARGTLLYKQVGPLTEAVWDAEFAPRLAALAEAGS
jgi:cytochrome c biogenesis protein CcmG, thiol:disulfide interchange protein DsbE